MLNEPLPSHVNPRKLAAANATIAGSIPLSSFRRLVTSLVSGEGDVNTTLKFYQDDEKHFVLGSYQAVVSMECQFCLEPVMVELADEFQLEVIDHDAAGLSEDSLVLAGESIGLVELLEDELILSLPMVARHPEGDSGEPDCLSTLRAEAPEGTIVDGGEGNQKAGTYRPFAGLDRLTDTDTNS